MSEQRLSSSRLNQQWKQKIIGLPLLPPPSGDGVNHMLGRLFLFLSTSYKGKAEHLS